MNTSVREILEENQYCVLGTVLQSTAPWSVPVCFAFDEKTIYFRSSAEAFHSKNIANNSHVSVIIFDSSQTVKGAVYIHSMAKKLEGEQERKAAELFSSRFNNPAQQWDTTYYFAVPFGDMDVHKSVDKMYYFQEQAI